MEQLDRDIDGSSLNIVESNIDKLKTLFPDIFSEGKIDFDKLRETLGDRLETQEERYNFSWNGKTIARRIAQTPSTGTLRPCKEESKNWDATQNLFIEGDNLEVLKLLQKSYHKQVKMIYIDPPYNTGKEFIYPDNYKDNLDTYLQYTNQKDSEGRKFGTNPDTSGRYHTNWLNMMYPRLKLAKNLLRDDGVIIISIDDNEVTNLRKLCDEIFGEENFIDTVIWKKRYGGGAKEKYLISLHEYALIYAKDESSLENIYIPLTAESIKRYYIQKDENFVLRGAYRTHPLEATKSMGERQNLVFDIPAPDGTMIAPKRQWLWGKDRVNEAIANNEIEFINDKNGGWSVHTKQYLKDELGNIRQGKAFSLIDDVYTQHGTNEIINLFGNAQAFSFPKPTIFIKRLLQIGLNGSKEAIILDFFSGSATTSHAIMDLNAQDSGSRKYIMVQLPEPCDEKSEAYKAGFKSIAEIGKERIHRAGEKILQDNTNNDNIENLDIGFKVFKLDSSNIKPWDADFDNLEDTLLNIVDNIKEDRSEDDVLYEILLKYGLDLTVPIEERQISSKTVYSIGLGALVICLDDAINLDVVEGIGRLKEELDPEVMRVVFKDSGFQDDVVKTNAIQILKKYSIHDVKSL